ncbi:bifunctional adenosylcobinamide kinase/adenosylcobinamide-phosphate guanylyltransferase [Bacillus sp. V59.32b]|uniref:bifunctional adenosylcobinamide kinase/adenosylcobinamide-phosphate guanylyltransferase n=1 Tax=Bacillus sp. V59.32b TaxID=1758642 RepID=UPI000E3EBB2A|nr:bifunctional adenosylcobinamide kinase/adenosylcobinamide-phosphate guanylyltransferase [Bacillus sp. V59.32b]RFU67947.1 cobinamide kinase [Bacillus sp. V59.32b]
MAKSSLIFVSGGVRSGKSRFAEQLAINLANHHNRTLYYLACGRPGDPEMQERIARHKSDRENGAGHWVTLEYPVAIEAAVPLLDSNSIVLLDCLTTLLNNEMFPSASNMDEWEDPAFLASVKERLLDAIKEIRERAASLIVVSNELLHAPITDDGVNHAYSKMIGGIHQEMVAMSDRAYLMEADCAILMKGEAE